MIRVTSLAALLLLACAAPAHAGAAFWVVLSAGGGIGAAFAATTIGGWLTGTLVGRLVGSFLLSSLQARLAKRNVRQPGLRTKVAGTGGLNPRGFILGRYATAGTKVCPEMSHGQVYDTPNAYLTQVLDLCDLPGVAPLRIAVDGEWVPLGAVPDPDYGFPGTGNYAGAISVKYRTGNETTADAQLMAAYASYPERPWAADMIGRGITQVILTARYLPSVFNGIPQTRHELAGIAVYDPRKDSTVGGVGLHRWDNPATWESASNAAQLAYMVLRGIDVPQLGIWGGLIPATDLPLASWTAAMTVCDQAIPLAAGGTEPRYLAGTEVKLSDEPHQVLQTLLDACNGQVADCGGIWKIRCGEPGLPVYFFDDGDCLVDSPEELDPFPEPDAIFNAITPVYTSPEAVYEGSEGPMLTNPGWEAEDGGRFATELQLPAVLSATQAQRIASGEIRDQRRWRSHRVPLPPDASVLEPLDIVAWTSARNGYAAKLFEVAEIEDSVETMVQIVSLREVDPSDYDWSTVDEIATFVPSGIYVAPAPLSLTGWALVAATLTDASGAPRRLAIRPQWTPATIDGAKAVEYELRRVGTTALVANGTAKPSSGEAVISGMLLAATDYEGRGRPVSDRPTLWTAWTPVTTGALLLTRDDVGAGEITRGLGPSTLQTLGSPMVITSADTGWVEVIASTYFDATGPVGAQHATAALVVELSGASARKPLFWKLTLGWPGAGALEVFSRSEDLHPGEVHRLVAAGAAETPSGVTSMKLAVSGRGLASGESITITAYQMRTYALIR